jgi:chitodextrinase
MTSGSNAGDPTPSGARPPALRSRAAALAGAAVAALLVGLLGSAPDGPARAAVTASPPGGLVAAETPPIFGDGFESGDLSLWTASTNLGVQAEHVNAGAFAARATGVGGAGHHAYRSLGAGLSEIYARVRFKIVSQGSTQVVLMRLRTGGGSPILSLALSQTGKLQMVNGVADVTTTSARQVFPGVWNEAQVHLLVDGVTGRSDIWLNGDQIPELSAPGGFGSAPADRIQIGDDAAAHTYDVVYDEVLVADAFIVDTTLPSPPAGLTAAAAPGSAVDLSWQPASDNLAVTGYDVYRDGTLIASIGARFTFRDAGLQPGATHTYALRAADAAGNRSPESAPAVVTLPIPPPPRDFTAPTRPPALAATAASSSTIDLAWSASSDNVAVTGYTVTRNGAVLAEVPGLVTGYTDTRLAPATAYVYTVTAVDAAGNRSAPSAQATGTTLAVAAPTPTTAPPAPRPLAFRLLTPRAAAAPGARVRIRYSIGAAARVTVAVLRNGRRVALTGLNARRGANAALVRAPRRLGRYTVVLTARRVGFVVRRGSAVLTVRVPVRHRGDPR